MSERLLPKSAYPEDLTEQQAERADARLCELSPTIPKEPGRYLDREGAEWVRHEDGSWTDEHGETKRGRVTLALGAFGPWSKADH